MNGMEITNGTNPFDDQNFATAINRLAALEKLVKKKIFILDAFPPFPERITWTLNDYLRHGREFKDVSFREELSQENLIFRVNYWTLAPVFWRLNNGCIVWPRAAQNASYSITQHNFTLTESLR